MSSYNTFSILFFIRKERSNSKGEVPIYIRITVKGKRAEISTNRFIDPKKWDPKANKAKGTKTDIKQLNNYLETVKNKIYDHHRDMVDHNKVITARRIKNKYLGLDYNNKSLMEVFEYHNKLIDEKIGNGFSKSTAKKYRTIKKHLEKFLQDTYNINDITLGELEYKFITDLEHFFRVTQKLNHNSTMKYIRNFKKIINLSVKNDWLDKDPFAKFQFSLEPTKRTYLDEEELRRIENKKFSSDRLNTIKDIFVFCCYTGLSYSDVHKLNKNQITNGFDNTPWVFSERTKTKSESNVPLLKKPLELIDKYNGHPLVEGTNRVFPPYSNAKLNEYLKEVQDLCEIENKVLTMHVARHTFATTVTLKNGISIESVSSMLGHKNIKTTQIYSKVVNAKVSAEMQLVKNQELNKN